MGQQIIKQPNGKYCLFSSVVNNVTHYDMTKEEIVEVLTKEVKFFIVRELDQIVEIWTKQFKKDFKEKVNDIVRKNYQIVEVWTEEAKKDFKERVNYVVRELDQLAEIWTEKAKKDFKEKVNDIVRKHYHVEKPYSQFTLSFVEMLQTILEVHGDIDKTMILKMIL